MGETIVPVPEAKDGAWVKEEEEWEECSVLELSQGEDGRDQSLCTAEERVPVPAPHEAWAECLACDLHSPCCPPSPRLPGWKPSVARLSASNVPLPSGRSSRFCASCSGGPAWQVGQRINAASTRPPGQSLEMAGP